MAPLYKRALFSKVQNYFCSNIAKSCWNIALIFLPRAAFFTPLEKDIDIGSRATEMCPNIKAIDIWLPAALEKLSFLKCCCSFPAV